MKTETVNKAPFLKPHETKPTSEVKHLDFTRTKIFVLRREGFFFSSKREGKTNFRTQEIFPGNFQNEQKKCELVKTDKLPLKERYKQIQASVTNGNCPCYNCYQLGCAAHARN